MTESEFLLLFFLGGRYLSCSVLGMMSLFLRKKCSWLFLFLLGLVSSRSFILNLKITDVLLVRNMRYFS